MSVLNHRIMGTATARATFQVHRRVYQGGPGVILTVPAQDGERMRANGYVFIALSAPTAGRPKRGDGPANARKDLLLWDETLAQFVVFDGATWRDPSTGNPI